MKNPAVLFVFSIVSILFLQIVNASNGCGPSDYTETKTSPPETKSEGKWGPTGVPSGGYRGTPGTYVTVDLRTGDVTDVQPSLDDAFRSPKDGTIYEIKNDGTIGRERGCKSCPDDGGGGGGGGGSISTPSDLCASVTCPSDSICVSGSCIKALSVSISPKIISVYANEEITFTITVKNELTSSHSITINAPQYYNNTTGTMIRMSEWDDSSVSYMRAGMDMMDRSDSFSTGESKSYTLRVRAPSVNTTTKIVINVSVSGTFASNSAEMNVMVDAPQFISFTYSGTLSYFNTFWNVSYTSVSTRNVAVKCTLNCPTTPTNLTEIENCVNSGAGQKCIPYPYTQPPGTGSCSVPNPQYRYLTANEIKCVAYDPTNTAIQTMSE